MMSRAVVALFLVLALPAWALPCVPWAVERGGPRDLALIAAGQPVPLLIADEDEAPVRRAFADLQADFERVAGTRPATTAQRTAVIVGTLGRSKLIDGIVAAGRLDVAALRGRWEGFLIALVEEPMPGLDRALVIVGSDARGSIYGIYELSQQIGVSPWNWWADVPAAHHSELFAPAGLRRLEIPTVQYRGIFLNDEEPALGGWVRQNYGSFDHRFHARLFELILRLRGNFLWPAMWNPAFFADDPLNGATAAAYGVVIGTSHHEPLMRAHHEWDSARMGPWDYRRNAEALREYWRGGLAQSRGTERVITIGMRGDGDEAMSAKNDIPLLERIVADQRELIKAEPDASKAPQVWALYKEVQSYYEQGMRVPDDVTLLWSDDNWGHLRRLPSPEERRRKGGAGIYYHLDYVGGPRNYKWIDSTPIPKIWEQMQLADQYGADKIWIVNVGDLKPLEVPTEFFLAMAWSPKAWDAEQMSQYLRRWAARDFGPEHAEEIAALVAHYTRANGRRKPELLAPDSFSVLNYREFETLVATDREMVGRARRLFAALPTSQRDAFFQLVLYPLEASAVVRELYYTAALNQLYARQGRVAANAQAQHARELFAADAALARRYNEELGKGRWNHMMDQIHLGYTYWNDPPLAALPPMTEVRPVEGADMAVALEGSEAVSSWSTAYRRAASLSFPVIESTAPASRRIEVFNRGNKPFGFQARASVPWIEIEPSSGQVQDQVLLNVHVRWQDAPQGTSQATVLLRGDDGREVRVELPLNRIEITGLTGHVESGGVVSIEAEHYDKAVAPPGRAWQRIPGHGQTLSGMGTQPASAAAPSRPDMHLDYAVHLFHAGEVRLVTTLAPTLRWRPDKGLRFAVSIDDETPQIVEMHADESNAYWDKSVIEESVRFTTRHRVDKPGAHTLHFWALDPSVVVHKLVIDGGGLKPSTLGPPESPMQR
ncbi:MAG: glycosyl hydrolase 115 family protein [Paucibacter sp.]|nr:glycosyl hydrolase 115 family protein [Roseateles sp.]